MRKVGELPEKTFLVTNTLQLRGRTFHFHYNSAYRLTVYEVILGDQVRCTQAPATVPCSGPTCCCLLGGRVLVMTGNKTRTFAFLVDIDDGELTHSSVHVTKLNVEGGEGWSATAFLSQILENRALLYFSRNGAMRLCDLEDTTLRMTGLRVAPPRSMELSSAPISLPDGKLLVSASSPLSTDITVISTDGDLDFERIGNIPGAARERASCVFVRDRFVVGFGGDNGLGLDDLWIFDMQTRNSSVVWEKGEWHPPGSHVSLIVHKDSLYLIGGSLLTAVSSVTFQALAELIHDDVVRKDFCLALGLPSTKRCDISRPVDLLPGKKAGEGFLREWRSYSTVDHQGRVVHFSQDRGELVASELIFGPRLKPIPVRSGLSGRIESDADIGCCSVGDKILVMAGRRMSFDRLAALVTVEAGEFGSQTVHFAELTIEGCARWSEAPFLVQIGENKAWLSFFNGKEIWICTIEGSVLRMQESPSAFPTALGFGTLPIPLPDGKLLVAGACPLSTDITLVTPGDEFTFEKIGSMPGKERYGTTSILVGNRFVIGFGGLSTTFLADLWMFDLVLRKSLSLKNKRNWLIGAFWAVLAVKNGALYVIGGRSSRVLCFIPLSSLASLISYPKTRLAFVRTMGLSVIPSRAYRCSMVKNIPCSHL